MIKLSVFSLLVTTSHGFLLVNPPSRPLSCGLHVAPTSAEQILILKDADAVGAHIRQLVEREAKQAIGDRGYFALAIPGGSILNMLVGSKGEWTKKTTIAYVNHKCVAMDDEQLATHAKAMKLFMKDWEGCNPIMMNGSADGVAEAKSYSDQLKALGEDILPRNGVGFPVFDLSLIGVGDDGHIGSLYPNRPEILNTDDWVLPVAMKDPPSITLSLPVMTASKTAIVAACGVSAKYPQGKSDGMRKAVADEDQTIETFPACGLRTTATWVMDKAAASKLGEAYNKQVA